MATDDQRPANTATTKGPVAITQNAKQIGGNTMDRQEAQDRQDIRARQERDRSRRIATTAAWQLTHVDKIEWTQDKSGLHVYINWDMQTESVRLDVFDTKTGTPLVSFTGFADNVRKATMEWLTWNAGIGDAGIRIGCSGVSLEHASYIGAELEHADTERIDYVQD